MLDDIKKTLWATPDKLRANMDAAECKHLALGLILVKYDFHTFATTGAELTARLSSLADPYYCRYAAPEDIEPELKDCDDYAKVNAFWIPEAGQLRLPEAKAMPEETCA